MLRVRIDGKRVFGDIRFLRKDQQRGEAVYEYRSLVDDQFFDQSPVMTLLQSYKG